MTRARLKRIPRGYLSSHATERAFGIYDDGREADDRVECLPSVADPAKIVEEVESLLRFLRLEEADDDRPREVVTSYEAAEHVALAIASLESARRYARLAVLAHARRGR